MPRPRSIPRTENGLFAIQCPHCGKVRERKTYPCAGKLSCISCQRKGRANIQSYALSDEDFNAYESGVSAAELARRNDVPPITIIRAIKRQGRSVRNMSQAVALLGNQERLAKAQEVLRKDGEMSRRLSAGHQGITRDEWEEFRADYWKRERSSKAWKEWRKSVYERDGYKCVMCGSGSKTENGKLHPRHIYPKARFPERMYDTGNGVTLCGDCHESTFGKEESVAHHFESYLAKLDDELSA